MKRTITVLMTLALIGSMAFVGFAGTAAAGGNHHDDGDSGDDLDAVASVSQTQSVSQANVISQNASQFADQDATGVDIDEFLTSDEGSSNNEEQEAGSIEIITFQKGQTVVAQFERTNGEFDLVSLQQNPNIQESDFALELNSDGSVTYTIDNMPPGLVPETVQVTTSNEQTCNFDVDPQNPSQNDLPVTGTVTACGDNGGDNGNHDGTNGGGTDGIEGSVGNQTVNQIIDQDADASNSNAQNADASASAGDILSVLLG